MEISQNTLIRENNDINITGVKLNSFGWSRANLLIIFFQKNDMSVSSELFHFC